MGHHALQNVDKINFRPVFPVPNLKSMDINNIEKKKVGYVYKCIFSRPFRMNTILNFNKTIISQ